ncbi:hypothetical protein [Methylobacterium organophilum]|uniref:Uncharacterized protein n=1 Tax=Methylobacterium organophilum TaxID=410 RepID=A0ABQ4T6L7_METOR|nr:hypothetical protein [Methylobacterium organophilum]GJE26094.1 hypothetical protein LKMONMHP_0940 [Methylobacterium organophilum]
MRRTLLISGSLILGLAGFAPGMAQAQGYGEGSYAAPRYRPHPPRRLPPPDVRYRDPRGELQLRAAHVSTIQAYLPRPTDVPIYNAPPPRFPQ